MKESLHKRVEAVIRKASTQAKARDIKTVGTSSLHQIIKTKEQADRFMKLLKEA